MDLRDRLRAHMDSELSATRVRNLGDVMERGEAIRRRRRLMAVTLPMVAALTVGVGVMLSEGIGPGSDRELPEVDAVAAADARLSVQQASLDWQAQPATLGPQQGAASDDGVLFALSTAPGARFQDFPNGDVPKAIYASTDGTTWEGNPVGGSWVSSIAAADGLLYAVGTAPGAEEGTVALRVSTSQDRGESFRDVEFDVDVHASASVATRVMATDEGVLATATGRSSVDPFTLLPPGVLEGAVEPLLLEEGIAVFTFEAAEEAYEVCFGPQADGCSELIESEATHFSSWEELGLDGDETPFGEIVEHFAFWTEDGEQFEEVDYPFPDGFVDGVFPLPDETVVSVNQPGGTRLFTSRDARSWEPIPNIPGVSWITALGEVNGEVAIVAQTADGPGTSVFRAPDLAGPWTEISIDELLGLPPGDDSGLAWITAATVGEGGVALNLSVEQASGDTGNPIASLARRLLGEEAASPEGREGPRSTGILLVSRDLAEWSAVPSTELGTFVDSLMTAPDGRLVAHATDVSEGRPVRRQYTAQP